MVKECILGILLLGKEKKNGWVYIKMLKMKVEMS